MGEGTVFSLSVHTPGRGTSIRSQTGGGYPILPVGERVPQPGQYGLHGGGMPLAFTQEDFLVITVFSLNICSAQIILTRSRHWIRKALKLETVLTLFHKYLIYAIYQLILIA